MRAASLALLFATIAAAGCTRERQKSGPLVAEGAVTVTVEEFRARLDEQSPQVRARYATLERKKEFLENLLRFELLAKEAERKGLDKDPEVQAALKKAMVQKLVRQAFDEGERKGSVEEARAFYDQHRDEFVKPERVRVQLVWLPAPSGAPQRTARAAEARKLLARVKAEEPRNPLAFSNVAREASQDPSTRAGGGDTGYLTLEELAARYERELAAAAFALQAPGQVSPVVETPRGLALLKLTARQPGLDRPFDEVKDQLVARVARDRRTRELDEYVKGLRGKASITVHDAELERIPVAGPPGLEPRSAGTVAPADPAPQAR